MKPSRSVSACLAILLAFSTNQVSKAVVAWTDWRPELRTTHHCRPGVDVCRSRHRHVCERSAPGLTPRDDGCTPAAELRLTYSVAPCRPRAQKAARLLTQARRIVVKSARRSSWSRRAVVSIAPGSNRWPRMPHGRANARQDLVIVSSGAIALGRRHLGLPREQAAARGKPGGRGGRPDPARARLEGSARATRPRRIPGTADLR